MAEGTISIVVKEMGGKTVKLDVSPSETVASLKARVAESHQIPVSEQKLAWRGKNLDDEHMLSTYRLRKRATLLLMRTPAAAAAHNAASLNGSSDGDLGIPPKPCLKGCGFYGYAYNSARCESEAPCVCKECTLE
jgi:Ubiquitin family